MGGEADVIIIGAGVAGLAAADVLSAEGKRVLILEARGRIGGRIETMHDPAWAVPIERGAEFIHGKPAETWDIVRAGACCVYDVKDEHWVYERGKLRKQEGFFEEVEKVMGVAGKVKKGGDMSFEEALKKFGGKFSGEAKRMAKGFVEGFDAADAAVVSCRWLQANQEASEKIEGDRLFRVHAGYDRIVQFLRTGLDDARHELVLNTVVRRVKWGGEHVEVEAADGNGEAAVYGAKQVVVTVPVGVLQAGAEEEGGIVFVPELPREKREAIGRLRMGPVVKVLLRFREAFWEERWPDLDFFHAPGEAFPTWWTTLPMRSAVLTGWSGGPAGARLSEKSEDEVLEEAVGVLSRVLGLSRRKVGEGLAASHVCNWQRDAFARGAYSFAAVGGGEASKRLAKGVGGRLFFAGEATHGGMSGTVAGAIASGQRVAREILRGK